MTSTPKGFSELALATGLASVVCVILHLTTTLGWWVAAPALVFGALGVCFGVVAIKKRQPKGMAVTGIVTGAVGFLVIAGALVFALAFLGVLTGEAS